MYLALCYRGRGRPGTDRSGEDGKLMKLTSFVYALLSIKFRTALEYIIPLVMQGQKIYMNHRTVKSFFWITLQSDLVFA